MAHAARPFVIIGTPGDRRVTLFQEALAGLDLPPASVIAYADLLENRVDLDTAIPRDAIVRIESPGKSWEVNRSLALRGQSKHASFIFPSLEAPGDYIPSAAWFRGFKASLNPVVSYAEREKRSDLLWMQMHTNIWQMFDKFVCRQLLQEADIPTPPDADVNTPKLFLKAPFGSSGTGIVALQQNRSDSSHPIHIYTTLAMYQGRLVNTRQIRHLMANAVDDEALPLWEAYEKDEYLNLVSEVWIPKATTQGGGFDLRIVMIAGRMRHVVVRVSETPITNLHLLNKRGDWDEVRQRISDRLWREIEETCEQVAALFLSSLYMGIDLLISSTWNKHYVLEVNAFGDLLPNLLHEGDDTYTAEIKEIVKRG